MILLGLGFRQLQFCLDLSQIEWSDSWILSLQSSDSSLVAYEDSGEESDEGEEEEGMEDSLEVLQKR